MPEFDTIMPPAIASMVLEIDGGEAERTTFLENIGQRYPINGRYTFPHMVGFSLVGDTITYDLTYEPKMFVITASMVFKADSPGSRIHYAVQLNGTDIIPELVTGTYLKTAGEAVATAGLSFPIELSTGDELNYVIWGDTINESVTLTHFTSHILPAGR